jgi:hypothetical protein
VPHDEHGYPVVPHQLAGSADCCGCLIVEVRGTEADLICNECGAMVRTVPAADAKRVLMEILCVEICSATCPHCGALNTFPGFSSIEAYICSECGLGVSVPVVVQ